MLKPLLETIPIKLEQQNLQAYNTLISKSPQCLIQYMHLNAGPPTHTTHHTSSSFTGTVY